MTLEQIQQLLEAARHIENRDARSDLLVEALLSLSDHTGVPVWARGYHRLTDDQRRARMTEMRQRADLVLIDMQDRSRIRWADTIDLTKVA